MGFQDGGVSMTSVNPIMMKLSWNMIELFIWLQKFSCLCSQGGASACCTNVF